MAIARSVTAVCLPVTATGLALPCGASGRWTAE